MSTSQESYCNARSVSYLLTGRDKVPSTLPHLPPAAWTTHSYLFRNSDMGGRTYGIHRLMLFVPPSFPPLPRKSYSPQTTLDPLQAALNPITLAPPAADLQAPATQEAQVYQEGLDILPFHLFRPHAVRPGIGFHVFITPRSSGGYMN